MDHAIDLPDRPPAPWLRLAHLARFGRPGSAGLRRLGDWQFLLVVAGRTWLGVPGHGRVALPAGAAVLVPPGLVYDWGLDEHTQLAVHFDLHAGPRPGTGAAIAYLPGAVAEGWARRVPTWTARWRGGSQAVPLIRLPPAVAGWRERLAPLLRFWAAGGTRTPAEHLRAAGILGTAVADWLALGRGAGADGAEARVRDLLDRLATEPPDRHVSIPALARGCGLGEAAFRVAVRAVAGESPRRWLERRRVQAVAAMLADPRVPVAEAAALAGYDDPFHFARVVRRVTGVSPRGLRR